MGDESSNNLKSTGGAKLRPVGKNIVVVGNGPCVLKSGLGEVVDKMDTVVRINLPGIKGFEQDVGSRTDMWMFGSNKRLRPIIAAVDAPETRMVLVCPHNVKKATKFIKRLRRIYAERGMLFDWLPDEPRIRARYASNMTRRQRLTAGAGAIVYIRHTYPDSHIYLHGFDFVCSDTPSKLHYWDPKERGLHGAHSITKEAVYIRELIAAGHVSVLTVGSLKKPSILARLRSKLS